MTTKLVFILLLLCNTAFAQEVKIVKTGEEKASGGGSVNYYSVSIYNNTNKPICVPVSNYFAYRMNTDDTLELGDIYNERDSIIVISLFWSKKDLAIDPQQMPSYPVIINPRTYLLTNITFMRNSGIKDAYFEFKYSFGPELDYKKISTSYSTEPKFRWKKALKFIDSRMPIQL